MICKHILLITFLNVPKLIILHTVKWFQVLLYMTNNSIKYQSFVYTQLNDKTVTYWSLTQPSIKEQVHPVEDITI